MKELNFKYILINITIFLTLVLNNSTISQVIIFILFVVSVLLTSKYTFDLSKAFFILIFIVTLLLNISALNLKTTIRFIQIFMAFSLFPLKIERSLISTKMLGIVMIYIFIMTVGNIFGMVFESRIKDLYYPLNDIFLGPVNFDNVENITTVLQNRYGTFFYNANILGQTILLILVTYLIAIHYLKKNWFDYLILILGTFCLIVSGGRTSFVIFLIVAFFTIIWRIKGKIKYLIISLLIPIFILLSGYSRLFKIVNNDKNMDSVGIKFNIFGNFIDRYLTDFLSTLRFLFGTMKTDIQFDNDIGYMMYFSGVLSLIYFIYFFLNEFLIAKLEFKPYHSVCLITISATIVFNFKFLILTIIIYSLLRKRQIRIASKVKKNFNIL